jgi:hypothetical protein
LLTLRRLEVAVAILRIFYYFVLLSLVAVRESLAGRGRVH